jgi:hypothetical protein
MALAANRAPERASAPASQSPADGLGRPRGGSPRSADKHARPRSCGENTWRLHMLVRTWSRDSSEIFKQNPTKTWHYIFVPAPPRPLQNQWVRSCAHARTVEDGLESQSTRETTRFAEDRHFSYGRITLVIRCSPASLPACSPESYVYAPGDSPAAPGTLKIIANAVLFERHPLERTVLWRIVANGLSMTLDVDASSAPTASTTIVPALQ